MTWSARLDPASARPGQEARILLEASIEEPWHLYSMTPREEGPRPTRIELLPHPALAVRGDATQPEPKREFDEGFKIEVEYFDGSVQFVLPVRITERLAGPTPVLLKVRYQACKGGACLPPKTVEVPVTLS